MGVRPVVGAVLLGVVVAGHAHAASARPAPTVTGPAGHGAVVTLAREVDVDQLELQTLTHGTASGFYLRRVDGPSGQRHVVARYYDGYDGQAPIWNRSTAEVLPAGRYAVTLLGSGTVSLDLDRSTAGPRVAATRSVTHRTDSRQVPLSQTSPGRWEGGLYEPLVPGLTHLVGAHFEGDNVVGDSDVCMVDRAGDDCVPQGLGPQGQNDPLPRWARVQQSFGRHQLNDYPGDPRRLMAVSYDGLTPPERITRTLLSFAPL